ncbi:hypothetical protein MGN70_009057 [Eutypa lata]|uniref:DUF7908 domain-containing protein n=1 Tax=Eutypa lata (strain UCR-EL1) TaxID=1287681 RepID=M7SXL1_EUTLA|nr:hypothetical protein UCREL1_1617 [Eutypa lata UCREL1]KAI1249444.1 hypothetical protein MGN70_009057 [Eutypa lata]
MGSLSKILAAMALISQTLAVRFYTEYDGGKFLSYQPGADDYNWAMLVPESEAADFSLDGGNLYNAGARLAQIHNVGTEPHPSYRSIRFDTATSGWNFWSISEDGRLVADQTNDGYGVEQEFIACPESSGIFVYVQTGSDVPEGCTEFGGLYEA